MTQKNIDLDSVEGFHELREETTKLKQDFAALDVEAKAIHIQANQYLVEINSTIRTVDFQKAELEKRGEELKQLQKTVARLTKKCGEKE